ncbi:MAG: hypothetical protein F2825_00440 [Actinobacteria bacterium]|uniref:Unannotated protein n=1 Tax=freshwater metagenome TaxID=449393 RepID=A0A6J7FZY1_9ZZZZ|nr:hypothetical protein [Actinomycetota bacterium]
MSTTLSRTELRDQLRLQFDLSPAALQRAAEATPPRETTRPEPAPHSYVLLRLPIIADWKPNTPGFLAGYVNVDDEQDPHPDPDRFLSASTDDRRDGLAVIRYPTVDGHAHTAYLRGDLLRQTDPPTPGR